MKGETNKMRKVLKNNLTQICRTAFLLLAPTPAPRKALRDLTLIEAKMLPWYVDASDFIGMYSRFIGFSALAGSFCDDAPEKLKYISLACYSVATVLQDGIVDNYIRWNSFREKQAVDKLRKYHGY